MNLFTIIAKDKVVVNEKATKEIGHNHSIRMSIMQFITEEHAGIFQEKLFVTATEKMILPGKYTILKQPVCTVNIEGENDALSKKKSFMVRFCCKFKFWDMFRLAKHHSKNSSESEVIPGIHSMILPIHKKVSTLEILS